LFFNYSDWIFNFQLLYLKKTKGEKKALVSILRPVPLHSSFFQKNTELIHELTLYFLVCSTNFLSTFLVIR